MQKLNRILKIIFPFLPGFYMMLVGLNNLFDYQTNFYFLSQVTSMTDLISGNTNTWRAISQSNIHNALYITVISWELFSGFLLLFGAFLNTKTQAEKPKTPYFENGLLLAILLWFFVFVGIAGEWFLMWQSEKFNAQTTAFFLTIIYLLFYRIFRSKSDVSRVGF